MARVLLWTGLLALTGTVLWVSIKLWRVLAIGAAYKAKILSTIVFLTGGTESTRAPEVSADSYWILRLFRTSIDVGGATVTASFLGLRPRTAVYRPGLGTTLADDGGNHGKAQSAPKADVHRPSTPWPVGAGSDALQEVVERAFTEPNPRRLRRTRAIVVVRDGHVIAERYAPGRGPESFFAGWSMAKSVLGALVGILVGEGRLALDEKALMPGWRAPDPRSEISLEDLLRMRSGLKFSEVYSDLGSDVIEMLFNRADVVSYAASQPLIARPGTVWSYASGTTNILSGIIRRRVGETDYLAWPRRALFDPIGMDSAVMEVDGAGNFVCSSFMLATARDWARFGQLHLDDGVWGGHRVLPEGWVRFSVTPTAQSPTANYGAHWWLKLQPEIGGGTPAAERLPADAFFAVGHEGQTLTVIPSRRLVIVRLGVSIYVDAWDQARFVADVLDAL